MARMRRNRPSRYIGMAYRINAHPRGLTGPAQVYQTMYDAARMNVELPPGWDITWRWQNSKQQEWREAPFADVVGASRAGFLNRMLNRIEKDAMRRGVTLENTELREASEEEIEDIENRLDEQAQEGAYIGLENRRRAAREQAREHEKRSAAARKGWETRRRNERKRKRKK